MIQVVIRVSRFARISVTPIVLLGLLLLVTACGTPIKSDRLGPVPAGLKDGIYQASASYFPGAADVEIIVENGRLKDVILKEHRYGLGGEAGNVIPGRIVEEQSTDVDAVSGATGSSIIIMEAVQSALEKAAAEGI